VPVGAAAQGMLVSVAELAPVLEDPGVVVLHVADNVKPFEDGHVRGARFVRYGDFAVEGPDQIGSELPSADVIKRVFEAAGVALRNQE
jgi:3-mercaptopyruvate sulfurtransferase SseA